MPLTTPSETLGASNRRSWRTPSADSNAPVGDSSLAVEPALVAWTSIVPGVRPAGGRSGTAADPPSAFDDQTLAAQRVGRGNRHRLRQR